MPLEQLRRGELIDATIATIAEQGFMGTTIRDVADRAGCSPASVLYYFPRKDDLLATAFREADQRFRDRIRREVAVVQGIEKLTRIVDLCFPDDDEDPAWSVEIDVWAFAGRAGHDDLREMFETASSDWLDLLVDAVTDAVGIGELAVPGDARSWAVKLAALIDGFAVHTRVTKHVDNSTARSMLLAEIEEARPGDPAAHKRKGDLQ